ncbi:hypothetical protein D3C76_1631790 [compost metagenome]
MLFAAGSVRVVGTGIHLPGEQSVGLEVRQVFDHVQQLTRLPRMGQEQVDRLPKCQARLDLDGIGVPLRITRQVDQYRPDQFGWCGDVHDDGTNQIFLCGHG